MLTKTKIREQGNWGIYDVESRYKATTVEAAAD
jgi:hypothetical protein